MKIDNRIKSLSDILAGCGSGIKKANEFLGEKGYFAGDLYCFTDLQKCPYGTLANVFDDNDYTFQMREEEDNYYPYFIPECSLKPKEEQVKLELQSPLWIDARIPKNIIVPYDFINTIKEKFKNDIIGYSQECEGTFKIKDGKVTDLNLTGVALIPRSKDGERQ